MDEHWLAQFRRGREEVVVDRVVEEEIARPAVHHGAHVAGARGPLELGGDVLRGRHGQGAQRPEPGRVAADGRGGGVVRGAAEAYGVLGGAAAGFPAGSAPESTR